MSISCPWTNRLELISTSSLLPMIVFLRYFPEFFFISLFLYWGCSTWSSLDVPQITLTSVIFLKYVSICVKLLKNISLLCFTFNTPNYTFIVSNTLILYRYIFNSLKLGAPLGIHYKNTANLLTLLCIRFHMQEAINCGCDLPSCCYKEYIGTSTNFYLVFNKFPLHSDLVLLRSTNASTDIVVFVSAVKYTYHKTFTNFYHELNGSLCGNTLEPIHWNGNGNFLVCCWNG